MWMLLRAPMNVQPPGVAREPQALIHGHELQRLRRFRKIVGKIRRRMRRHSRKIPSFARREISGIPSARLPEHGDVIEVGVRQRCTD
jgi:hypothetical protein